MIYSGGLPRNSGPTPLTRAWGESIAQDLPLHRPYWPRQFAHSSNYLLRLAASISAGPEPHRSFAHPGRAPWPHRQRRLRRLQPVANILHLGTSLHPPDNWELPRPRTRKSGTMPPEFLLQGAFERNAKNQFSQPTFPGLTLAFLTNSMKSTSLKLGSASASECQCSD
jgi:hypothetical protein